VQRYSYSNFELASESAALTEPTFRHQRFDVYRRSIAYVAFSCGIVKALTDAVRLSLRRNWRQRRLADTALLQKQKAIL